MSALDLTRLSRSLWLFKIGSIGAAVLCAQLSCSQAFTALVIGGDDSAFRLLEALCLAYVAWVAWNNIGVIGAFSNPHTPASLGSLLLLGLSGGISSYLDFRFVNDANRVPAYEALSAVVVHGFFVAAGLLGFFGAFLLKNSRLTVGGRPFSALLSDLPPAPRNAHLQPQNPRAGRAYLMAAAATMLVLLVLSDEAMLRDLLPSSESARLWGALFQLPPLLVLYARHHFQPTASALLSADSRPPIVYLRSFADDRRDQPTDFGNPYAFRTFLDFSLESRLAAYFHAYGPFVSLGSPRQNLMHFGAARDFVPDEDWKRRIETWLDEAAAILFLAGVGPWLKWELQQILAKGQVAKLVVIFPPWSRDYERGYNIMVAVARCFGKAHRMTPHKLSRPEERLALLQDCFFGTAWETELRAIENPVNLRGLAFLPDGRLSICTSTSQRRETFQLAAMLCDQMRRLQWAPESPVPARAPATLSLRRSRRFATAALCLALICATALTVSTAETERSRQTLLLPDRLQPRVVRARPVAYQIVDGSGKVLPREGLRVGQPAFVRVVLLYSAAGGWSGTLRLQAADFEAASPFEFVDREGTLVAVAPIPYAHAGSFALTAALEQVGGAKVSWADTVRWR